MVEETQLGRLKKLTAAALLTAALTLTAACGDDDEPAGRPDGAAPPTATKAKSTSATSSGAAQTNATPEDGRLTTTTGDVITDYGDRRQRQAAVRTLKRLQRRFQAGDMAAACSMINDFLLSQFKPRDTGDDTPCPEKLEAYAAARARRGAPAPRMRLLWVRVYTGEAGIWVDDARDKPLRIQFTSAFGDGWRLDLGVLNRPEVLAAKLIGADRYVGRR